MAPKRKNTESWDVYEQEQTTDRRRTRYDAPVAPRQSMTIAEEDDEEIDESDAFDSEDERKYGGYFEKKETKDMMNESQDEESESGESQDSGDSQEEGDSQDEGERQEKGERHEEDESEVEESDSDINSGTESDGSFDLAALLDIVAPPKKRSVRTTLHTTAESQHASSQQLSLSDLVPTTTSFSSLKSQATTLYSSTPLPTPAPHRLKLRLDRVAAYEEAKTSVTKFQNRVKKNREADSVTLDIHQPARQGVTLSSIASQHNPLTPMEQEVNALLVASQLTSAALKTREGLAMNLLSREEMNLKRIKQLKQRSLLVKKEKEKEEREEKEVEGKHVDKVKQVKTSLAPLYCTQTDKNTGHEIQTMELGVESEVNKANKATPAPISTKHTKQEILAMAFGEGSEPDGFFSSSEEEAAPALLGWGSWSNQAKPQKKKAVPAKPAKVLRRVIVDGKLQKTLKPYMVSSVPHGYESKAQFERTMRMGLGKEWNTATVFQKRVKPRIVTKPGQVILPMK